MLEHLTPLEQLARVDDPAPIVRAGWSMDLVTDCGLLLLQQYGSGRELDEALSHELKIRLPRPCSAMQQGDHALLWLTPREWLLVLPRGQVTSVQEGLARALSGALASVTELTDAFVLFELKGDRAWERLMTGCSVNLRPDAFGPDTVIRTALAATPVILWQPSDAPLIRCLVDRSLSGHLWRWLTESPASW